MIKMNLKWIMDNKSDKLVDAMKESISLSGNNPTDVSAVEDPSNFLSGYTWIKFTFEFF